MGNSNAKLNTLGKSFCGGVSAIPGVGGMIVPFVEKYGPSFRIFRSKPREPNETMMMMGRMAEELDSLKLALASQGKSDARLREEFQIRVLADAQEQTNKTYVEAMQAKEEVAKLQRGVQEAESRQLAAETVQSRAELTQLKAAVEDARKQEAAARSREEDAIAKLGRCFQPDQLPSKQQIQDTRNRLQYSDEKFHFAFCGFTGTGKSSLINSCRGLKPSDPGAAAVGTNETTLNIARYADPSSEPHFSRLVWYDIPGGGTAAVSNEDYYLQQGLYIFDAVIVVYADRFTELDERIIKDCVHNNTPVFIVRSKSDQHIDNKIRDEHGFTRDDDGFEGVYPGAKAKYVEETHSFVDRCLRRMAADPDVDERDKFLLHERRLHRVYIVSAPNLLRLVKSFRDPASEGRINRSRMIDEEELISNMLTAAGERRP